MKNFGIEIKWALIFTIAIVVWTYIEKMVGLHDEHIDQQPKYTMLFAIPAVVIYAFALIDKKHHYYHGVMSWKQGFVTGIIMAFMIALLSPLTQYIIQEFITPDYFSNVIAYSVDKGVMNQQQAETYFNLKNYILQSVFGALSMGVLTAAIVSLFVKTKNLPNQ